MLQMLPCALVVAFQLVVVVVVVEHNRQAMQCSCYTLCTPSLLNTGDLHQYE